MSEFAERLREYDSDLGRRRQLQDTYPDAYVTCPGCVGEDFAWCPLCLGTRRVTRATERTWTEPGWHVT